MINPPESVEVTLDDLLALVEKAAGVIDRLHAANTELTAQLRKQENAVQETASELEQKLKQIEELEQEMATLRKDAHWCQWFRRRYGGENFTTFYAHIEREYRAEFPDDSDDAPMLGPGSSDLSPL